MKLDNEAYSSESSGLDMSTWVPGVDSIRFTHPDSLDLRLSDISLSGDFEPKFRD